MSYATLVQMLNAYGGAEMARLCDSDFDAHLVTATPQLMVDAIDGADLSGYTAEQQAAAAAALDRGTEGLTDASSMIDSRLGCRYTVPITGAAIESNALPRIEMRIARYLLADDLAIEEVRNRYTEAMAWLDKIAAGKAALTGVEPSGSNDNPEIPGIVSVRQGQAVSNFDWSTYP